MVAIVVVTHAPGIAANDAVQALNGVDNGSSCFTQETAGSEVTIIQHRQTQTMSHLTNSHTATAGGNNVVDGWWFCLAQELPHQRTTQRIGR